MKRICGRRATASQTYVAAAWRWALAALCALLLLAGGSLAQDGLTQPTPEMKRAAEASTAVQAPDLNEALSSVLRSRPKAYGRAAVRERLALRKRL